MAIIFLFSLAGPGWPQTGYPQGPAASDSDRLLYPQYNLFGLPVTNRADRQMAPTRPGLPFGVPERQVSGSQPVSQPASNPVSQPATNPVSR